MDDLPHRPAGGAVRGVELLVGEAGDGRGEQARCARDLID
jgi:hypothetical protein